MNAYKITNEIQLAEPLFPLKCTVIIYVLWTIVEINMSQQEKVYGVLGGIWNHASKVSTM